MTNKPSSNFLKLNSEVVMKVALFEEVNSIRLQERARREPGPMKLFLKYYTLQKIIII